MPDMTDTDNVTTFEYKLIDSWCLVGVSFDVCYGVSYGVSYSFSFGVSCWVSYCISYGVSYGVILFVNFLC